MKCPKCGYLGFESVERCRNCGYDFSLSSIQQVQELALQVDRGSARPAVQELPLSDDTATSAEAPAARPAWDAIEHVPVAEGALVSNTGSKSDRWSAGTDLPLFRQSGEGAAPLITVPSKPRAPLAVRRATPEGQRRRPVRPRAPMLDLPPADGERPELAASASIQVARPRAGAGLSSETLPAGLGARVLASVVDVCVLGIIDLAVVYFTLRVCGLTMTDIDLVPKAPLIAFFILQNGGYLVAFNAAGQTLGKMLAGIRVVSTTRDLPVDLSRAALRTAVWIALAVPAGLGFLSAVLHSDHRGFHDRCAGTRVIRTLAA